MAIEQLTLNQVNREMQQCIQNCLDCHSICLNTVTYCLRKGGRHAEPAHIRLMLDCADICNTSANFMLRGSDLHARTCGVCAELCQRCADDCDRMGDDAQMKACADMCRRCADSCRKMAMATA
ncbi:four-helix bundle copper-binding protein [Halotia wernerae UHCC 0503]|nr:four-helix bundle copper-binding protein [Halotia wernerae UHCC 0503]